jgi:four helix bundle protein
VAREQIKSFEDLHIFQEARTLTKRIYALTNSGGLAKDFRLGDQMRRAAVSILSNIAEGFERGTDPEFARFLSVAKGSCGELRAQAIVALDQNHWTPDVFTEITADCRKLSAGLSNLISYLERSTVARRQRAATT